MNSKPIPVEYYEDENGFGLKFPEGIEADELLKLIRRKSEKPIFRVQAYKNL